MSFTLSCCSIGFLWSRPLRGVDSFVMCRSAAPVPDGVGDGQDGEGLGEHQAPRPLDQDGECRGRDHCREDERVAV